MKHHLLEQLRGFCGRFVPVEYAAYEVLCMRILFAIVVATALPGDLSYKGQPEPVGLAHFVNLTFLADSGTYSVFKVIYWIALVLFAIGIVPAISASVAALIFIAAGSLAGSQGADKHHLQIVGIVLFVFAVYYVYRAIKDRESVWARPRVETHRLAIFHAQQGIVAAYLVTGIYKLARSGLEWIADARYFPLQLAKTKWMDYYNRLEDPPGAGGEFWTDLPSAIESFLYTHPVWSSIFLTIGLILELGAFMLMAGRRWGVAYGLVLIGFHLSISRVMNLTFEYNMLLIAVMFVNLPWLVWNGVGRRGKSSAGH